MASIQIFAQQSEGEKGTREANLVAFSKIWININFECILKIRTGIIWGRETNVGHLGNEIFQWTLSIQMFMQKYVFKKVILFFFLSSDYVICWSKKSFQARIIMLAFRTRLSAQIHFNFYIFPVSHKYAHKFQYALSAWNFYRRKVFHLNSVFLLNSNPS